MPPPYTLHKARGCTVVPASFSKLKMPFQSGGSCSSPTFSHYDPNWSKVTQGRPGPSLQNHHKQSDYYLKCKPDLQGVCVPPKGPTPDLLFSTTLFLLCHGPHLYPRCSKEAGQSTRLCRPHLSPGGCFHQLTDHWKGLLTIGQEMVTVAGVTRTA